MQRLRNWPVHSLILAIIISTFWIRSLLIDETFRLAFHLGPQFHKISVRSRPGALGLLHESFKTSSGNWRAGYTHWDSHPEPVAWLNVFGFNKNSFAHRTIALPYWVILLIFTTFPPAWSWLRSCKYKARQKLGQCLQCGYDIRVSTDRCPECGTTIESYPNRDSERIVKKDSQPRV
jgi:hypothetical protein